MFKKLRSRKDKTQDHSELPSEALPYRSSLGPVPNSPGFRKASDATNVVQASDNLQDVARHASQKSTVSKFDVPLPSLQPLSSKERQKSRDRRADPQGLTVLYSPECPRSADIIFVHGLGGSSRQSWSKNRDLDFCWPQHWLPKEAEISSARILTFGYDAHFSSTGPTSVSNIGDFAKALLYDMKFGKDDASRDLAIGEAPVVFVVHSMGGLVFKKAYISGQSNPEYKDMIAGVRSVLFLSTPHRGTNLAVILNRILSASFIGHSSKQYIHDLNANSPAIEALNEDFRNLAPRLQIFCFYETLQTNVALKAIMVLEKDSSILGYPGEISRPLNADHHNVCKFSNPEDPSYKSICSALLTLIRNYNLLSMILDFGSLGSEQKLMRKAWIDLQKNKSKSSADSRQIKSLLGVKSTPEEDYEDSRNRWEPGTCDVILGDSGFLDWTQNSASSTILWLYARPGSGKSILSSYLINHLQEAGCTCAYYYFKYHDATKRSLSSLLRSIAFQLAQELPEFSQALIVLSEDGVQFDKADARSIWQKVFVTILFKIDFLRPVYWVVDALDESDAANAFLETMASLCGSKTPIKLLVTSRELPAISTAFGRIWSLPVIKLSLDNNFEDIRYYASSKVQYMHGSENLKNETINRIVDLAQGNFLWVDLAIKQVLQCHSPDDIQAALKELPPGMDALYQRMEISIAQLTRPSDIALSRIILSWATFARHPLTIEELIHILKVELQFSTPLNLNHTITELCGHFVVTSGTDRVTLVHQTAREYLIGARSLPFSLEPKASQETLFSTCFKPFLDTKMRTRLRQRNLPDFYKYAATSWSYHLDYSSAASNNALDKLVKFFEGTCPLVWIQILAVLGQLQVLVFASRSISAFVQKRKRLDASIMPLLHRHTDLGLLEAWAVDLLKVVGKYGTYLLQDPTAIHKYVPQLCPSTSMISRASVTSPSQFSVVGLAATEWDDCLARLHVGDNKEALTLVCHGRYLAVFTSAGSIGLWDSMTFEMLRSCVHNEHIFKMCFSSGGRKLASYGLKTTKIWDVSSGRQILAVNNPPDTRALAFSFAENDATLIMASDTRKVSRLSLIGQTSEWSQLDDTIMQEDTTIPDTFINSPMGVAFSPDMTELAVAYRGFPLTVWSLEYVCLINRCKRRLGYQQVSTSTWTGVNRVCWHPTSGDILGIYTDGMVFKWHPVEETHQELRLTDINATPSEIECSPDGIIFATSDVNGAIKLYNFDHFALVYQLSSEDIVTALCFAPDGKRFYDLRGSHCNVWEPNALIRLSASEDTFTDDRSESGSTSISILASEAFAENPVLITAFSSSQQAGLLFTGNEEGDVQILDMTCRPQQEVGKSATEMSIDHLTCSEDGKIFAYTDLGGRLVVRAVEKLLNSKHAWGSRIIMNVKLNLEAGGLRQLILSPDTEHILVASLNSSQVWSTKQKTVQAVSLSTKPDTSWKWAQHPLKTELLCSTTTRNMNIHYWKDLKLCGSYDIQIPESEGKATPDLIRPISTGHVLSPRAGDNVVSNIIMSQAQNLVLISVASSASYNDHHTKYRLLDTAFLVQPSSDPIVPSLLHPDVTATIMVPLAILGKDNLIYLDASLWVCSWRLSATDGAEKIQKHFFLPRDWLGTESLGMCKVMPNGTFLCPKAGEVAVVRSTLGSCCDGTNRGDIMCYIANGTASDKRRTIHGAVFDRTLGQTCSGGRMPASYVTHQTVQTLSDTHYNIVVKRTSSSRGHHRQEDIIGSMETLIKLNVGAQALIGVISLLNLDVVQKEILQVTAVFAETPDYPGTEEDYLKALDSLVLSSAVIKNAHQGDLRVQQHIRDAAWDTMKNTEGVLDKYFDTSVQLISFKWPVLTGGEAYSAKKIELLREGSKLIQHVHQLATRYTEHTQLLRQSGLRKTFVDLLIGAAWYHYEQVDSDKATPLLDIAESICPEVEEDFFLGYFDVEKTRQRALLHGAQAQVAILTGNLERSLYHASKRIDLEEHYVRQTRTALLHIPDHGLSDACLEKGIAYAMLRQSEDAISCLSQAVELYEQRWTDKDVFFHHTDEIEEDMKPFPKSWQSSPLYHLGLVAYYEGDYDAAVAHLKRGLQGRRQTYGFVDAISPEYVIQGAIIFMLIAEGLAYFGVPSGMLKLKQEPFKKAWPHMTYLEQAIEIYDRQPRHLVELIHAAFLRCQLFYNWGKVDEEKDALDYAVKKLYEHKPELERVPMIYSAEHVSGVWIYGY
ncbi:hypothetical protein MMC13_005926 [Lambiella insularis]|nr:hypothetical protein [Lambiella insularis]